MRSAFEIKLPSTYIEKGESHLPGYLQHWLGRGQVSLPFVGLECEYVPLLAVPNLQWHFQEDSGAFSRAEWVPCPQYIRDDN